MNIQSIIIDIRHQLPWQQRCLTAMTTVLLWAGWLVLWQPLMISLGVFDQNNHQLVNQIMHVFWSVIENGFVAILACALMLWLWSNFIPAKSIKYVQPKGITDYAAHFELSAEQIHRSRQQKIVTVHHDESGQIIRIERFELTSLNVIFKLFF